MTRQVVHYYLAKWQCLIHSITNIFVCLRVQHFRSATSSELGLWNYINSQFILKNTRATDEFKQRHGLNINVKKLRMPYCIILIVPVTVPKTASRNRNIISTIHKKLYPIILFQLEVTFYWTIQCHIPGDSSTLCVRSFSLRQMLICISVFCLKFINGLRQGHSLACLLFSLSTKESHQRLKYLDKRYNIL
jgi:hypothetical protein